MLDLYDFFSRGYAIADVPADVYVDSKNLIETTDFVDFDIPHFPQWDNLEPDIPRDHHYVDYLRSRKSRIDAPLSLRLAAQKLIDHEYFHALKDILVHEQHYKQRWLLRPEPVAYHLWRHTYSDEWHCDYSEPSDFFVLMYFSTDQYQHGMAGELELGIEDGHGQVKTLHKHEPRDGTMVVINNANPLFKHKIWAAQNYTRDVISIHYEII